VNEYVNSVDFIGMIMGVFICMMVFFRVSTVAVLVRALQKPKGNHQTPSEQNHGKLKPLPVFAFKLILDNLSATDVHKCASTQRKHYNRQNLVNLSQE
jgi:hypothetical protein